MTNHSVAKTMSLSTAIARFVTDGCHLSIGGFTINRNPMAAVYEMIRQKKRRLHLYAHSNGQGIDELIGAGCVERLEIAYAGTGRFSPTCVRFQKAVVSGSLLVEDYSNYQMTLRFMAGAMGVPFLPVRSGIGSDIVNLWGFNEEMRKSDPKLPNQKLTIIDNPFHGWAETGKLVLVPAIHPDVTIIHVQKADCYGTARIEGLPFVDVEQAKAARHVIVTCEEIVQTEELRDTPEFNRLPFLCVDAVVPVPMGAYPTACYRHYDYDPVYLSSYDRSAKDDKKYEEYLQKFVYGVPDHKALLAGLPCDQLARIAADPRTGYAKGLDRK